MCVTVIYFLLVKLIKLFLYHSIYCYQLWWIKIFKFGTITNRGNCRSLRVLRPAPNPQRRRSFTADGPPTQQQQHGASLLLMNSSWTLLDRFTLHKSPAGVLSVRVNVSLAVWTLLFGTTANSKLIVSLEDSAESVLRTLWASSL